MKTAFIVLLSLLVFSCKQQVKTSTQFAESTSSLVVYRYEISGMTCPGCEEAIKAGVMKLDGIESVTASFEKGEAIVKFNPELTDTAKIKSGINNTGYKVLGIYVANTDDNLE